MTEFVRFIEKNEAEGEDWSFWLQWDGNEDAIGRLEQVLAEEDPDIEQYVLDTDLVSESVVDILVQYTLTGYMDYENKVTGKFIYPEDEGLDGLYKGKIVDYFTAEVSPTPDPEATPE